MCAELFGMCSARFRRQLVRGDEAKRSFFIRRRREQIRAPRQFASVEMEVLGGCSPPVYAKRYLVSDYVSYDVSPTP